MFELLSNWKLYILSFALIGVLSLNVLQKYKLEKLEGTIQVCNANLAIKTVAINIANDMRAEQERKLRLREQEAAHARAESLKRRDNILSKNIQGGCEGASQFLLDYALDFNWSNNIP